MPRTARIAPPGYVYHALNRGVAGIPLFKKPDDYVAFEQVLVEAHDRVPIRLVGYCLMPTHWHFVLWPEFEGELTEFLRWLTHTHTQRWHAHRRSAGSGHLYQGRFKTFPVQENAHFYKVLRYVERNAVRAKLCPRAEAWKWGSLHHRLATGDDAIRDRLSSWPVPRPRDWADRVNQPETENELEALRRSVTRGQPFGTAAWQEKTAKTLGLEFTFRLRGRPRKPFEDETD